MSNCISITNHSDESIEIVTVQDSSVAEGDRKKTIVVTPKETFVIFLDRVEAMTWTKKK